MTGSRADDESSIDGCTEKRHVAMPPECSFLSGDVESVGVTMSGSYRTLSYINRPICPSAKKLKYSVPEQ